MILGMNILLFMFMNSIRYLKIYSSTLQMEQLDGGMVVRLQY